MRTFINILTLIVFIIGTIQFANVASFCRMSAQAETVMTCSCSDGSTEDGAYFSTEEMMCCSTKKFEKDRVQDFASFKDEISKLASFQVANSKSDVIHPQYYFIPKFSTFNLSPPKSDIPILKSSLLI